MKRDEYTVMTREELKEYLESMPDRIIVTVEPEEDADGRAEVRP